MKEKENMKHLQKEFECDEPSDVPNPSPKNIAEN